MIAKRCWRVYLCDSNGISRAERCVKNTDTTAYHVKIYCCESLQNRRFSASRSVPIMQAILVYIVRVTFCSQVTVDCVTGVQVN